MKPESALVVAFLGLLPCPLAGQDTERVRRQRCDGGDLLSCNVLGLMYETGAGGTRDLTRAAHLYQRACDGGVTAGCTRLQLTRESGVPVALADGFLRIGWVADAETGAPIHEAIVDLPAIRLREVSDQSGRVELGHLREGRYRIVTQRSGYETLRGELPVPWNTEFLVLLERSAVDDPSALGRIFGRITEDGGIVGLSDVDITVLSPTPVRTVSDPQGRFTLTGLEPGSVEVRFTRLGFAPRTTSPVVRPGRTVVINGSMSAQPIELEPLEVTVGSSHLERSGFYRRARNAGGSRFTRRDVDVFDPQVVSEGVEVYQGSGAPIEYRNIIEPDGTYPCGVVLIWTRRP